MLVPVQSLILEMRAMQQRDHQRKRTEQGAKKLQDVRVPWDNWLLEPSEDRVEGHCKKETTRRTTLSFSFGHKDLPSFCSLAPGLARYADMCYSNSSFVLCGPEKIPSKSDSTGRLPGTLALRPWPPRGHFRGTSTSRGHRLPSGHGSLLPSWPKWLHQVLTVYFSNWTQHLTTTREPHNRHTATRNKHTYRHTRRHTERRREAERGRKREETVSQWWPFGVKHQLPRTYFGCVHAQKHLDMYLWMNGCLQ